jgi:hypothetical protein
MRAFLAESYCVTDFWLEGGSSVAAATLNTFDVIFFWQVLNPVDELRRLRTQVYWAPMYDGETFNPGRWKQLTLLGVRIVAFARPIQVQAVRFGLPSLHVRYFPEPAGGRRALRVPARIFIWDRGSLPVPLLASLFAPSQVDRIVYRGLLGEGGEVPRELAARYRVEPLPGRFLPREEYRQLLETVDVYVAPRRREGIGLTFLEALAMGKCVVAYDEATMNEYVTHGTNGLLFTETSSFPLDLQGLPTMADGILALRDECHAAWRRSQEELRAFLSLPARQRPPASRLALAGWGAVRWLADAVAAGRLLGRGDFAGLAGAVLARLRIKRGRIR